MEGRRKNITILSQFNPYEVDLANVTVEAFLNKLNGPSYIVLNGADNSRTRVFVTLLHGNEPSGVMALLRWLKEGRRTSVRIVCILASVKTALQAPLFYYRTLPGVRDLNRCFQSPFEDSQGQLAKAILELIHHYRPEAVIDMHNTSGTGPAFGVATHDDKHHHALTLPFSDKLVITHLKLGALMDISEDHYPTVTIEVGGRLDQGAHEVAWKGLHHYFTKIDILKKTQNNKTVKLIVEPIRLEIRKGASLAYANTPNTEFDVTLIDTIDQLNFSVINAQTQLGWVNRGDLNNFVVNDCKQHSTAKDWLRLHQGKLYPKTDAQFFMITTNPVIAIDDCLFYGVKIRP
ncbi:MAG: putative deacylase [Cellvibrionaceae bacterium]|jgi:predicted deacylase